MRPGRPAIAALVAAVLCAPGAAHAQCMLANPGFDHSGTSGTAFAGWNQFGTVSTLVAAYHGIRAARITGPNTGNWDVSGVWQRLDAAPGRRFQVNVRVQNLGAAPLQGGSAALVNIEWRDAGGGLIAYESHAAADASTPTGVWRRFAFETGAAPAGTAAIHFLLGVLQGPGEPTPQVLFDIPECVPSGPPTLDELQWTDFPTSRALAFSGYEWRVKGPGFYGPGPNLFDGSSDGTWVDALGRLHLRIHRVGANWYSSEVTLTEPLGYGDYVFTTRGRLDQLDVNAVLGMFLWEYGPCYDTGYLWWNPYNEIDVEFSRWGSAANSNAQFVAQPAVGGNIHRFHVAFADSEVTSHAFRWLPNRVEYRSWRGGPGDESALTRIASWTYAGADQPRPEMPRVHLNLWHIAPPATDQEVVFDAFTFVRDCSSGDCGVLGAPAAARASGVELRAPAPNPFVSRSLMAWTLPTRGPVSLVVLDIAGRAVRRLVSGEAEAGEHRAWWDGRDDAGHRVRPGAYLVRLRTADGAAERRLILLD